MNETCEADLQCAHCGRTDTVMGMASYRGGRVRVNLCHANRDGTKADPDCYHLVTTKAEQLGRRLRGSSSDRDTRSCLYVPADQIESIVGVARHPKMHYGRAVSAEQKMYILHSQECRDHRADLRECGFSIALERGIHLESWAGHEDVAVALGVQDGLLIPLKGTEVPNG